MDQCIICEKEVKYYKIIYDYYNNYTEYMHLGDMSNENENEICCQDCHDDLRLDWEELKQDK